MAQTLFNQPSFSAFIEPFMQLAYPNWQTHGVRCRVLSNQQENPQVFTLTLKPQAPSFQFEAGQYVDVYLNKNGSRHLRTFSISSSPEDYQQQGTLQLTIRIQADGALTPWMATQLQPGHVIYLGEPAGQFVLPKGIQPVLMIAGGSGITPFRSMLRSLSQRGESRSVCLIYFAREPLFEKELVTLYAEHPNLDIHFVNPQQQGHLTSALLKSLCPDFQIRQAMICGPHSLIKASRALLNEQGVDSADIHYEYFGAEPIENISLPQTDGVTLPAVRFSASDTTAQYQPNKSLLEIAEDAGLKPLHGCRRGVCHQCVCKKESGVVYNTIIQQHSDTGPEHIQLCVSVPVTATSIQL